MANVDWPCGFRPVTNGKAGTAPRMRPYPKLAGLIYEGELLYMGEGGVATHNGTTDVNAQNIIGVAAHYCATAADTGDAVFVYDDPDQEFVVQLDGHPLTNTAAVNASIGRYFSITGGVTGNTTTLQSKQQLTGAGTSIWLVDHIIQNVRLWKSQDNEVSATTAIGSNLNLVCKISHYSHVFSAFSITRGV